MFTSIIGELYTVHDDGRPAAPTGWPAGVRSMIYFYRARIPQPAGIWWRSPQPSVRGDAQFYLNVFKKKKEKKSHFFLSSLSKVRRRRMVFTRTHLPRVGGDARAGRPRGTLCGKRIPRLCVTRALVRTSPPPPLTFFDRSDTPDDIRRTHVTDCYIPPETHSTFKIIFKNKSKRQPINKKNYY